MEELFMPKFLLLLHRPASTASGSSPEEMRERIARYRRWREEMTREGKILAGEKLVDDGGIWLGKDSRGTPMEGSNGLGERDVISGYFLIQASDYEEARSVAGGCPHLELGGTIELRQIEPS
jgi:hypothetical protein